MLDMNLSHEALSELFSILRGFIVSDYLDVYDYQLVVNVLITLSAKNIRVKSESTTPKGKEDIGEMSAYMKFGDDMITRLSEQTRFHICRWTFLVYILILV